MTFEYESRKHPRLNGDGWEYWYQAESLRRPGSPELWSTDMQAVNDEAVRLKIGTPLPQPYAYAGATDGRLFGVHFWAYGLTAAPFANYQSLRERTPLAGLPLANVCLYFIAAGVVLFGSSAPIRERLALLAAAAIGPLFWYIEWTGAELFSWAWTMIAVVCYRDRRYDSCGLAAGLAALQNPTIVFLGAAAVAQAARERRFRTAGLAALGTAVGLMPYAFYLYHFGKPNLITAEFASVHTFSFQRTWGLIGDFNQGLLPYVPVVVLGMVFGFVRMVVVGNGRGIVLAAGGLAMAIATQVAHNWNSACDGLQRYLVWMLPVAAGVAVEGIGGRWRMWVFAILAGVSNLAIFVAYNETMATRHGFLTHTPVAEWALTHCPRMYWAEPEVFIERERHADNWPMTPSALPVAHIRPDGTVSKMILDAASVEMVAVRFDADPAFMDSLREQAAGESGLFYSHPPHGTVRAKP